MLESDAGASEENTTISFNESRFFLLLIGLAMIYSINLLGLLIQTPILCSDNKFSHWVSNSFHKIFFLVITILSFLTNYKLKMIVFSKLFSFTSARAQLETVQKFRIFNILSFLGAAHEVFIIYICAIILSGINAQQVKT